VVKRKKRKASKVEVESIQVQMTAEGVIAAIDLLSDRAEEEYFKFMTFLHGRKLKGEFVLCKFEIIRNMLQEEARKRFLAECDSAFLQNVIAAYRETLSVRSRRTSPDFLALLHAIHTTETGEKDWSEIYAKWLGREPRLAGWCRNPKSLRVRYERAKKAGFQQARPKLKPVPDDQVVKFPGKA
jgi:hypothetical protein